MRWVLGLAVLVGALALAVGPAHRLLPDGIGVLAAAGPTATPLSTPVPTPRPTPVVLDAATTVLNYPPPPLRARAAILVDERTGKVLYAMNADARLPMASTTKITTAAVVLDHAKLGALVRASRAAAAIGESTMELQQGEVLSVHDLLYGLLLNSGNDAAVALAEYVGGTQRHFVAMMNDLARRLHMRNTHYETPHGLDTPGHYTSARDLATMALYAMKNPTFRQIVSTENYHIPATRHNHEHWLGNINRVMYRYPGVNGVKPGDTDNAGLCQVVSDTRNGHSVLAVLLNTPDLYTDIRNLLNMGTDDFAWVQAPIWTDAPSNALSGGRGNHAWLYYEGAGHYIRGPFLTYFQSHGGLRTLGYPRTEAMAVEGTTVQYFEGGVLEQVHGRVVSVAAGAQLAQAIGSRLGTHGIGRRLRAYAHFLGDGKVLGNPVTGPLDVHGVRVQFFQNGALALDRGVPRVVPVGDALLRLKGWFPSAGEADAFPPSMDPGLEALFS